MSVFRKLFGGSEKSQGPTPQPSSPAATTRGKRAAAAATASRPSNDPANDPNMIKVHDAYGRELFMTRESWRDSVMKGNIEAAWNDPERLGVVTTQLLQDQFLDEALSPAERLFALAPDSQLSVVLIAIVYTEL